ncbi:MAG: VC1465 family Xer recombination activation factor [Pseudomonadota bacterium]
MLSSRFKILVLDSGLSVDAVANELHVTPRTVYAWLSGKTTIPYAAYRLLRILARFEFPDPKWRGWHMHSGKLWTPEGHGFEPGDSSWWSLLVRQARCFRAAYQRSGDLERAIMELGATARTPISQAVMPAAGMAPDAPGEPATHGAAAPAAANLFLAHFRPLDGQKAPVSLVKRPSRGSAGIHVKNRRNKLKSLSPLTFLTLA